MSRGLLGANSKIQFRHQRGNALKQADLVILAGSVCDFRLQYGRSIPRSAKIICVNRNKEQLWKVCGLKVVKEMYLSISLSLIVPYFYISEY